MSPVPEYDIEAWRSRIPLLSRYVPMNNCSRGPLLDTVRSASEAYLASWNDEGMQWEEWMDEVDRARATFAGLIGAARDDVAVVSSVSHAVAAVAGALEYGSDRSEIVVSKGEFPTVGHVWLAHERLGARVRWVEVTEGEIRLDDYRAATGRDTLLVQACHGYYQTGFKQDLAALVDIAHSAGALISVDAYQTMGTHPIDVRDLGVDFLAAGNLKYLMGSPGIAFLYVRPEVADRLRPNLTGWFGQSNPFSFEVERLDYASGTRRFDSGTPPIWNAYVARAGMEAVLEVGPGRVKAWTEELSRRLIEGADRMGLERLGPDDPARKTPSTAFLCPGDSHLAEARLRERGVLGSARGPALRLAPHFYSTPEDVDVALEALSSAFASL